MTNKLVSIILPTYNGQDHVADSIESCLRQTYSNIELIIVNDCSKDNTLEIAKSYAEKDARVRVVDNPHNLKLPASLNAGFAEAKGDFLTWTSDDNMYRDNAIERMVDALTQESADFVYCGYTVTDMDGNVECVRPPLPPEDILSINPVGACFLYTREVYKRVGNYNIGLFCAEDYEYWSRIYRAGFKIVTCAEDLYIYRRHPNSLTTTKSRLICLNTEKVIAENLRCSKLSAKQKSDIYLDYYNKAAIRGGRSFSFRFFVKYMGFRMLSLFDKGA